MRSWVLAVALVVTACRTQSRHEVSGGPAHRVDAAVRFAPPPPASAVMLSDLDIGARTLETRWESDVSVVATSTLGILRLAARDGPEEVLHRYPVGAAPRNVEMAGAWIVLSFLDPERKGKVRLGVLSLADRGLRWLSQTDGAAHLSRDGTRLVWSTDDLAVVYDTATLAEVGRFEKRGAWLALSPRGDRAAFLARGRHLEVDDVASGTSIFHDEVDGAESASFGSVRGVEAMVLGDTKGILIVTLGDGSKKRVRFGCKDPGLTSDQIDDDAGILVRQCFDGGLGVVDLATGKLDRSPEGVQVRRFQIGPGGDVAMMGGVLEQSEYSMVVDRTFFRPSHGRWHAAAEGERLTIAGSGARRLVRNGKDQCAVGDGFFATDLCEGEISPANAHLAVRSGNVFQIRDVASGKPTYSAGDLETAAAMRTLVSGTARPTSLEISVTRWPAGAAADATPDAPTVTIYPRAVPPSAATVFDALAAPTAGGAPGKKANRPGAAPATSATRGDVTYAIESPRTILRTEGTVTLRREIRDASGACELLGIVTTGSTLLARCGFGKGSATFFRFDAVTLEPRGGPRRTTIAIHARPGQPSVVFNEGSRGVEEGMLIDPVTTEPQLRLDAGRDFLVVRDFAGAVQILGNRSAAVQWLRCDDGGSKLAPFASCAASIERPLL